MKIAFLEVNEKEKDYLNKIKSKEIISFEQELNPKTLRLVKDAEIICTFIYSKINKEVLSTMKNLKAILTRSTGYEHIDLRECKKRKIKVFNVPSYGENTVAEHTFALILSLSRKINESIERTTKGNFSLEGLQGFDLKNKTIGIIGMGKIGSHVARMAKGFEMKVIATDSNKNKSLSKKLGFRYVSLEDLLKKSDIITLHCPYNKETNHLIGEKNIQQMKRGALIINTARGGLINTKALIKFLAKGHLGGAALDVLEEENIIREEMELLSHHFPKNNLENLLENHILLTFKNVIITPHNAFNSKEAIERIWSITLDNLDSVLKNKTSENIVK